MTIPAGIFKAKCLKIMDDVYKHHSEVIITKHGKAIAKLVAVEKQSKKKLLGLMKGKVAIHGDIVGPSGETWDADA
jgi:prevent-host-death family protein